MRYTGYGTKISSSNVDSSSDILAFSLSGSSLKTHILERFCGHDAYMHVIIDAYNDIMELNEENNNAVINATITDCIGR